MGNLRAIVPLATLDADANNVPPVIKGIPLFLEICASRFNNAILTAVLVLTPIHILENAIARYYVDNYLFICVILYNPEIAHFYI